MIVKSFTNFLSKFEKDFGKDKLIFAKTNRKIMSILKEIYTDNVKLNLINGKRGNFQHTLISGNIETFVINIGCGFTVIDFFAALVHEFTHYKNRKGRSLLSVVSKGKAYYSNWLLEDEKSAYRNMCSFILKNNYKNQTTFQYWIYHFLDNTLEEGIKTITIEGYPFSSYAESASYSYKIYKSHMKRYYDNYNKV